MFLNWPIFDKIPSWPWSWSWPASRSLPKLNVPAWKNTIANYITATRIFAVVPVVWLYLIEYRLFAFILFTAACLSDFLDGWLVRNEYSRQSDCGAFLDPFADKAIVWPTLIIGACNYPNRWYVACCFVIGIYDTMTILGRLLYPKLKTRDFARCKTWILMTALCILLFDLDIGKIQQPLEQATLHWSWVSLLLVSAVMAVISAWFYLNDWWNRTERT